ncbi:hypothetical protein BDZ89DRAFT_946813 [Hymenopellis radicata]|nr:hypothetical protein BDZ89DRAFT_946813 [Hymenopellis radicata]
MHHLQGLNHQFTAKQTAETEALLDRVYDTLHSLPWAGTIHGFSVDLQMVYLSSYLSTRWLTDEHEGQMLGLLEHDIIMSGQRRSVIIENTLFTEKLKASYAARDEYHTSSAYKWPKGRGEDMAGTGRNKLGTIAHTGGNHWIALVIDFGASIVYFGDSLGGPLSDELWRCIDWWTHVHTDARFMLQAMPITKQTDGFSCGILGWNALCGFFLGWRLLSGTMRAVLDERMKVFLRIVQWHNERVSELAYRLTDS